ncbi:Putative fucosyltransferase R654 [Galdieria sulphuraria]|uniref:Fucosyltransferase n=1 Tax=Galdieria sulphuraria TaxID=130081 RepID=M2W955_GALSU|nr:glycoprotein 3-alpha-L-fucosyltransferase [Galdieria sulphuraria]EME32386.1 glycoprotein 3-alpha-L-fucosyltransferase [Galdieria sulphuraria]GJD06118.1 Putative fucosyltransferase R654 [Galdieria sulphuraria]|eukprot:XP_005708906.1 glycoprotein 3-alpha-L-fucosyltransferase [Galdieria sulphuraria]
MTCFFNCFLQVFRQGLSFRGRRKLRYVVALLAVFLVLKYSFLLLLGKASVQKVETTGANSHNVIANASYVSYNSKKVVVVAYCKEDWAYKGLFELFNVSHKWWYFVLKEEPERADVIAHSPWGTCSGKYPNATKIFIDMEPNAHRGSEHSITVSTVKPAESSSNVLYIPYALWSFAERKAAVTTDLLRNLSYSEAEKKWKAKSWFAAFAARYCSRDNKLGETRTQFFDILSTKYKPVHALGNCRHNMDPPSRVDPPYDNNRDMVIQWYRPYKFSFCFENSQLTGYITEKLFNSFLADTIPIYWGAPNIDELVNTNAIIVCNEENNTFESCIKQIIALDSNSTLWIQKLQTPLFKGGALPSWLLWRTYSEQLLSMLAKFLDEK